MHQNAPRELATCQKVTFLGRRNKIIVCFISFDNILDIPDQCLSQDLETGCLKLAVVNFLGVQIFKGDHNILIFQP